MALFYTVDTDYAPLRRRVVYARRQDHDHDSRELRQSLPHQLAAASVGQ
jgi:hypothetical protein